VFPSSLLNPFSLISDFYSIMPNVVVVGASVGTVLAVIVILAIILIVIVVLHRRRLKEKEQELLKEIDMV